MRILVVEDNPETVSTLRKSLQREAFAVDTASDGGRGSYMAKTNDYDLIILDLLLPGKSGLEICNELRQNGKTTPIIILSVESEVTKRIQLLNFGADDYLIKPFSFEELLARIRALLRRPAGMLDNVIGLGDLLMDVPKHEVTRGEKSIYLTKKEFELLEYLLRNQGQVVSRGLILEHVWDNRGDIFSNTIETHILNLRRKLGMGKGKLIHTIPGRGYKLALTK